MKERRKDRRVKSAFPVYCKVKSQRGFFAVSKDLSQSGAKLLSSHMLPLNKYFQLEINLIDTIVRFKAKAVWRRKINKDNISCGLKFTEAEKSKEALKEFIAVLN